MSELFSPIDFLGTFVFAVTGASVGAKAKFDLFGMLFLAFLTAVGGGTVRDLILGETVFWTASSTYFYIILAATFSTYFLLQVYETMSSLLLFLDTLGMGMFVVVGTHKTLALGLNVETALIMGTVSAVLGGVLRSAFSGEFSILRNKELYATVAAASSLVFIYLSQTAMDWNLKALITIGFAFALRYGALKLGIKLPAPMN